MPKYATKIKRVKHGTRGKRTRRNVRGKKRTVIRRPRKYMRGGCSHRTDGTDCWGCLQKKYTIGINKLPKNPSPPPTAPRAPERPDTTGLEPSDYKSTQEYTGPLFDD
jgi:hypothetical protein